MYGKAGPNGVPEPVSPALSPLASQPAVSVKQILLREHELMASAHDSMDLYRKMRAHLSWEPGLVLGSLSEVRAVALRERYGIDREQLVEFRSRVQGIREQLKNAPSAHAVSVHFRPVGGGPGQERYMLSVKGGGTNRGVPSFAGNQLAPSMLDFLHNSEKEQTFDTAAEEFRSLHDDLTLVMAECGFLTVDTMVVSGVESYSDEDKAEEAATVDSAFARRRARQASERIEIDVSERAPPDESPDESARGEWDPG